MPIFCKQSPEWICNKTVQNCHLCWPSTLQYETQ